MERRKSEKGRHSGVRLFSGKVYCGECGTRLGSKVWHSTDKYKQIISQCNKHCKKNSPCKNGMHLSDEELKAALPQDQSEYQAKYEDLERFYNEKRRP